MFHFDHIANSLKGTPWIQEWGVRFPFPIILTEDMNARPVFDTLWMAGKIQASKSSTAFGKSESSHETNAKPTKCSRITFSEWLLFKVYKAKPTMAYDGIFFNGRPFHQRHCSVASGCFFLDMFMCHFSSVQRRSFRFMSPTTVDLPVVAHLQHGRKSGAGVLGACLDATESESVCWKRCLLSSENMWVGDPMIGSSFRKFMEIPQHSSCQSEKN